MYNKIVIGIFAVVMGIILRLMGQLTGKTGKKLNITGWGQQL